MPPLPSLIPDHLLAQMQAATTPLWRTIALSLAAVFCLLLLYLRRRRQPQPHPQPVPVPEKLTHPPSPPDTPFREDFSNPSFFLFQSQDPAAPPPFHMSNLNVHAAPPLLPTIRRHSCDVAQQPVPPTITHYERRISADSIGPRKSLRGTIMRGGPLAPGVRRNQWTIEIR